MFNNFSLDFVAFCHVFIFFLIEKKKQQFTCMKTAILFMFASFFSPKNKNRFGDKQLKYKNLKSVHRAQQATCLRLLHSRKLAEDLQFAIKQKKENIKLLKKLINERSAGTKQIADKCETLRHENAKIRRQIPQYVKTCQQFADFIEKTEERNAKQIEERTKLFEEVKQCRIQNIQKLIKFIFPLSQRISKGESAISANSSPKSSPTESNVIGVDGRTTGTGDVNAIDRGTIVSAETMNALAEATHTTYIRGRWVLQDSRGELQHVIVAPSLPGNCQMSLKSTVYVTVI